jgi:hypothetical protein
MFRWCCFATAVVFGLVMLWMVNDLRQEAKRSVETVNSDLPEIVVKSRQVADTVHGNLPDLVEKSKKTAAAVAALSEDVQQIRNLLGISPVPRDKNLVAYIDGVLDVIEASGGTIGLRKKVFGEGLKDTLSAKEWIAGARKAEALYLAARVHSKTEFLERLCENKWGSAWYIQIDGKEPLLLLDWVKANHPPSRELETETTRPPGKPN